MSLGLVTEDQSFGICDADINFCLKCGTLMGSVALGYDKEGSDIDIVVKYEDVKDLVCEVLVEDWPAEYILEKNDVEPDSWFSAKFEDDYGIVINLIVCLNEVAEFKWRMSAAACKVADELYKELIDSNTPFKQRCSRKRIYQEVATISNIFVGDVVYE